MDIIPIEDLPAYIDQAIAKVTEGVALARRRGILAELPKEIKFDVTLVSRWQDSNFAAVSTEESKGKETSEDQGQSESKTTGTSSRSGAEKSTRAGESRDQSNSAGQNATYTYS